MDQNRNLPIKRVDAAQPMAAAVPTSNAGLNSEKGSLGWLTAFLDFKIDVTPI